jgi:membrane fusion protein, heavy metal efflux system
VFLRNERLRCVCGHAADHAVADHTAPDHGDHTPGEQPAGEADAVHFKSKEALARTGIELVPVEERPMVSELVASGVAQYGQRHIAQLSARVPGSVWRVKRHLCDSVRKGDVLLVIESREVGSLKADLADTALLFVSVPFACVGGTWALAAREIDR